MPTAEGLCFHLRKPFAPQQKYYGSSHIHERRCHEYPVVDPHVSHFTQVPLCATYFFSIVIPLGPMLICVPLGSLRS